MSRSRRQGALLLPFAMLLTVSAQRVWAQQNPLGQNGDIRVTGDFDGDGQLDYGVWRPADGTWYIHESSHPADLVRQQWGLQGDIPVPGDYDGDGKTDFAVWRPSTATWYILPSGGGAPIVQQWGLPGDIPVPAEYDGKETDMAVWRPSDGTWYVLLNNSTPTSKQLGQVGDAPFTGDFDGDHKSEMAVYRYSTQTYYILSSTSGWNTQSQVSFSNGSFADVPFVGDFDGDGKMDYAVWRPYDPTIDSYTYSGGAFHPGETLQILFSKGGSTHFQSVPPSQLLATNFTVPGFDNSKSRVYDWVTADYDGDHIPDFALFDPTTDRWFIALSSDLGHSIQQTWGVSVGDIPVPADYFGGGHADLAVWSPASARWYITSDIHDVTDFAAWLPPNSNVQFGLPGDVPQPGDYDGDGRADLAVWRPSLGTWYVEPTATMTPMPSQQWGLPGDIPVAADYEGDGQTHYAVYRPSLGLWYITAGKSETCSPNCGSTAGLPQQWGLPVGDQPVVGDFDADGRADFNIWRPTMDMFFQLSATGATSSTVGLGFAGNSLILNEPPLTPSLGPK